MADGLTVDRGKGTEYLTGLEGIGRMGGRFRRFRAGWNQQKFRRLRAGQRQ